MNANSEDYYCYMQNEKYIIGWSDIILGQIIRKQKLNKRKEKKNELK